MNTYRAIPSLNGLFWLFKPEGEPEPITISLEKLGRQIKRVNGAQRDWLAEGEYLVGPVEPPALGEQGSTLLTYDQVLSAYRKLLSGKRGKALVVGKGIAAVMIDGNLAGVHANADGTLEMNGAFDFDRSSFHEEEGRWDDDTAEALKDSIENPVFVDLPGGV